MNKKEEEIQQKLLELEATVLKENTELSTTTKRTDLTINTKTPAYGESSGDPDAVPRNDAAYFGGLALLGLGLLLVFQHVRISSGFLSMLGIGSGGFGLLFIPLMIGIGMMFYNYKNKWAWVITAGSSIMILLTIIMTLTINFPGLSLMQAVIMFLPFALGGSFLVKGLGGPKGVMQSIKKQLPDKSSS